MTWQQDLSASRPHTQSQTALTGSGPRVKATVIQPTSKHTSRRREGWCERRALLDATDDTHTHTPSNLNLTYFLSLILSLSLGRRTTGSAFAEALIGKKVWGGCPPHTYAHTTHKSGRSTTTAGEKTGSRSNRQQTKSSLQKWKHTHKRRRRGCLASNTGQVGVVVIDWRGRDAAHLHSRPSCPPQTDATPSSCPHRLKPPAFPTHHRRTIY